MELSTIQKIVKFFTSQEKFEEMIKESKLWKFRCLCGQVSSIWEIGGIRYKAFGNHSKYICCPHCRKFKMQKLFKSEEA